jgi:hypothetical protein
MHKDKILLVAISLNFFIMTLYCYIKVSNAITIDEKYFKKIIKSAAKTLIFFEYEDVQSRKNYGDKIIVSGERKLKGDKTILVKDFQALALIQKEIKAFDYSSLEQRWRDDYDFLICFFDLNLANLYADIYGRNQEISNLFQIDFINSASHFLDTKYGDNKIEPFTKKTLGQLFWQQFSGFLDVSVHNDNLTEIDKIKLQYKFILGINLLEMGNQKKSDEIFQQIITEYPTTHFANNSFAILNRKIGK